MKNLNMLKRVRYYLTVILANLVGVIFLLLALEFTVRSSWFQNLQLNGFQRYHAPDSSQQETLNRSDFPEFPWTEVDKTPAAQWEVAGDSSDYINLEVSNHIWDGFSMHVPNQRAEVTLRSKISKQILYSQTYSTDSMGRRLTIPVHTAPLQTFLAVAGCSFVFGDGLPDHQTLASYLQKDLPSTRVFNFGRSGGAPNTLLEALLDPHYRFFSDIEEEDGIFLYNVIDDQIPRTIGSMARLRLDPHSWNLPNFDVSGENPVHLGTFYNSRSFLFKVLTESKLAAFLGVSLPGENEEALQKTANLIKFVKFEVLKRKPRTRFVVVMHPSARVFGTQLSRMLKELGIEALDYSRKNIESLIPGKTLLLDGHPSHWSNQILSLMIKKDLELR